MKCLSRFHFNHSVISLTLAQSSRPVPLHIDKRTNRIQLAVSFISFSSTENLTNYLLAFTTQTLSLSHCLSICSLPIDDTTRNDVGNCGNAFLVQTNQFKRINRWVCVCLCVQCSCTQHDVDTSINNNNNRPFSLSLSLLLYGVRILNPRRAFVHAVDINDICCVCTKHKK